MKKIMFSTKFGLEQAVLDGRKTMTRRIAYCGDLEKPNVCYGLEGKHKDNCVLCDWNKIIAVSAYKVGEVVAIAQSYKVAKVTYRSYLIATDNKGNGYVKGFLNKMYVRPDLMPHHIRITNIRVERLQDISDEDCLREGIEKSKQGNAYYFRENVEIKAAFGLPSFAFQYLIDKVSEKCIWNSNPYVFVYEFELVD